MARMRTRESVTVGGGAPPPPPARPLVVIVHEGDDRVELAPKPDAHSPTEVQHARTTLLSTLRNGPPLRSDDVVAALEADRLGMARVVSERDQREAEVHADRAKRREKR